MSATRMLAKAVLGAAADDLGATARIRIREHLKDGIGVSLAAVTEPPAAMLRELVSAHAGQPDGCYVLGSDSRASAWDAAWVNGSLGHLLDFDDYGHGHPTTCIIPAALAIGELRGARGLDLMVALAVGWEVFERLSKACRSHERAMRGRGVHPTTVYGGPAAAATAGWLLGLDDAALAVAIGLAASASGGITEQFGTWGKGVQAGNAARAGVVGALLAERGFRGSPRALDGEHGLLSVFAGPGNYDLAELEGDVDVWAVEEPGVSIKRYPACGGTLRGIDAALELRAEMITDPGEVEAIDVELSESMLHSLHVDRPAFGFEGKFCIRFCVAVAIADGAVTIDSFTDESLARPIVQALMDRTTVHVRPGGFTPGPDTYRTPVTVALAGGVIRTREVAEPRGNTKNRMTYAEISDKFTASAGRIGSPDAVAGLDATIDELESVTAGDLVTALAAVAGS